MWVNLTLLTVYNDTVACIKIEFESVLTEYFIIHILCLHFLIIALNTSFQVASPFLFILIQVKLQSVI